MESPLWIEAHTPEIDDLPQPHVRSIVGEAAEQPLNLLLYGPSGAGKTATARALGRAAHADPENDFVTVDVADFFDRSKSELTDDPRFAPFLAGRSGLSKRDMMNHVLAETASHPPVAGDYKTVLLDDAGAMREDFQQALRRVMERHHEATRFVIATGRPGALIPPIRSRCVPVAVRSPTAEETASVVGDVLDAEGVAHDETVLDYLAAYADGDLRRAITVAQTAVVTGNGESITVDALRAATTETADDRPADALRDAVAGAFTDARSTVDELLDDYGGDATLRALLDAADDEFDGRERAAAYRTAGAVDAARAEGNSNRVQVGRLLAALGE
jgi:replication factor C small subunit